MQPQLNCSSHCDSPLCSIHLGVNRQEGLDVLQRLCSVSMVSGELPRRPLSPVLSAVVWTLLSGGILLVCCFLLFTLRFKNNRIVKMSSPNLNVLTLVGSLLTYISGFLFAVDERNLSNVGPLVNARVWTLCIGSTLVFGPILGKTWRLYRVFTQRLPDKRVIIRDIQLMGMVAMLILVDLLVLTIWNLSDPVKCSRSVGAVVKVVERGIFYSLSQMDSCSSEYADLWAIIIAVQKGCLLLYGTYLAGLTSNVSHPPVNQSPTIITAVTLVTLSMAVVVPVSIFLQTWPNLVYSTVAGAIFICTSATNCMLFVPQMMQWRQFEEDQNNPGQMAKYFSSPSKSQPSVYSQDEIYYLLGENSSMKKLLNEKNAVIDSLQEQVKNAKDKLLRLMSASQQCEDQDLDSSATNLNSCSTQTTEIQSDGPSSSSLPHGDSKSPPSPTQHAAAAAAAADVSSPVIALSHRQRSPPNNSNPVAVSSPCSGDLPHGCKSINSVSNPETTDMDTPETKRGEDVQRSVQSSGTLRTADETVKFVNSLQNRRGLNPFRLETLGDHGGFTSHMRPTGFVSSEQLQEILQELSLDAVMESSLRSPGHGTRLSSQRILPEASTLSPLSLRTPRSPHPPAIFSYPTISPYAMRKRRPPFGASRRGLNPACFYTECRHTKETCENPSPVKNNDGISGSGAVHSSDQRPEEAETEETAKKGVNCPTCVSQSHRCSAFPSAEHEHRSPPVAGAAGDCGHQPRPFRDPCEYWDSDSSSSTDYCYYHRPYCDSCLQRGSFVSSDSSSDSSDSEYEGYAGTYRSPHPVVFKEDLKPTFV